MMASRSGRGSSSPIVSGVHGARLHQRAGSRGRGKCQATWAWACSCVCGECGHHQGLAGTVCDGGSRERVQEGEGNVGEASKLLQECARAAARRERGVVSMPFPREKGKR
jgi:hypothetical protein